MRMRKALRLLLAGCLLAIFTSGQTPPVPLQKSAGATAMAPSTHTADDPGILRETQLGIDFNGRSGLVWWIPFEFWVSSAEKNGTPADQTRKNLSALQDYTVVSVLLGKVSALGSVEYVPPEELRKKTIIRDSDGQEYTAIAELTGDAKTLADVLKPMLANAMGRAGDNFAFLFFPAKGKNGKAIADATTKGQFSVVLKEVVGDAETTFLWRTPLTSLSPPRYCPVGKERIHADWDYCPWHGVKLVDKP